MSDDISFMSDGNAHKRVPGSWSGDSEIFVGHVQPRATDGKVATWTGPQPGVIATVHGKCNTKHL